MNLHHYRQRLETVLAAQLPRTGRLAEAMRYSTLDGGKRLRALLLYAVGEDFGLAPAGLDFLAAAVEGLHAYSLIHDDLPAMDDDDLRRGKPSNHRRFDEATAILAGDGLQSWAFLMLARAGAAFAAPAALATALECFARSALQMVQGQMLDMEASADPATIHALKTGALIQASLQLGAVFSPDYDAHAATLSVLGAELGLGYQILDDLLDATADSATLGKTAGKDAAQGKNSAVARYGLAGAEAQLNDCRQRCRQWLESLPRRGLAIQTVMEKMLGRRD